MIATLSKPIRREYRWAIARCRPRRLRTMREFCEEEIVIPEGRWSGRRWRAHRQPYAALAFQEIDSGRWSRFAFTGCVQSGKTFHFFVVPIVYHLFELGDSVVLGAPSLEICKAKWVDEVLPVIQRTRYASMLPTDGRGSRGGVADEIHFTNGAKLKMMSGRGGDETRSSFTGRVVCLTEVDRMDKAAASSREADPITQLENRSSSWPLAERRAYLECTATVENGRIWSEYVGSTASQIVCPCVHCGAWVAPEREHLLGWADQESELAAEEEAAFQCPECSALYDDADRRRMNLTAKLVHNGQEIDPDGVVHGEPPRTRTLGFRWSGFHNLFLPTSTFGAKEWRAARTEDEQSAEREMLQFYWAKPHSPPELDLTPLDPYAVRRRLGDDRKGSLPADTEAVTVAIDVGKWLCWWIAIAWRPGARGHICDYGTIDVPAGDQDVGPAILSALRTFRDDYLEQGWQHADGARTADAVLVDSQYQKDAVFAWCRESGRRYLPVEGLGYGQRFRKSYSAPRKITKTVIELGEGYHVLWSPEDGLFICQINVDHWKSWLHERLATPFGQPGAMGFFRSSNAAEHTQIAKHLTSEKQVEEFVPGKGNIVRWEVVRRANHFLDTTVYGSVGGHLVGVRLVEEPRPESGSEPDRPILTTPDGRPFLVTER